LDQKKDSYTGYENDIMAQGVNKSNPTIHQNHFENLYNFAILKWLPGRSYEDRRTHVAKTYINKVVDRYSGGSLKK
jgi:hypothetical protein